MSEASKSFEGVSVLTISENDDGTRPETTESIKRLASLHIRRGVACFCGPALHALGDCGIDLRRSVLLELTRQMVRLFTVAVVMLRSLHVFASFCVVSAV